MNRPNETRIREEIENIKASAEGLSFETLSTYLPELIYSIQEINYFIEQEINYLIEQEINYLIEQETKNPQD